METPENNQADGQVSEAKQPGPGALAEAGKRYEQSKENPANIQDAYERASALEKELREAKEALKAAENRVDPAQLRQKLKEQPRETLDHLGLDFNSVLESYLHGVASTPVEEPDHAPDQSQQLVAEVGEIKRELAERRRHEIEQRELQAISNDLGSAETPILRSLAKQGQPVDRWILQAAIARAQKGEKDIDYRKIAEEIEAQHRGYFENIRNVVNPNAETAAPASKPQASATLSSKLVADAPNERREAIKLEDRRQRAIAILNEKGWSG